ncbi:glutamate synthase large subunit [Lactococcus kimchii]|uniref:glutamate synthase large subunit n=1 Tax=Lactococcus sp. S-13 TaxID=2507158 RepID=UPI001022BB88|nr:glutamate synthase large subunit [Lactococcus sp. S-13]RZI48138.1 glutamate synthase large subunit [Lactococcus sp. S-13]
MNKEAKYAQQTTLWDPSFESDACGMGFIAQIDGKASHQLVEHALTMLTRMNHRGGTGAEPETGDGAGILLALPDEFFRQIADENEVKLPKLGDYAVGQFFLSRQENKQRQALEAIKAAIKAQGHEVLFTRSVPFNYESCGATAQKIMPAFVQVFVEKRLTENSVSKKVNSVSKISDFETDLFQIRRALEKRFEEDELYICSLSSKTVVYKGMLHAYQVKLFYPDLSNPIFKSTIALTHSRFSTNTFPSWNRAQPFRFLAHNGEINTLRGAENWMKVNDIEMYNEENSDSAKLENCMEYLYRNGRELPESLLAMIPEAWGEKTGLSPELKAFYEYSTAHIAPWDGPAALVFTDGTTVGARLDRNGLRPSRYLVTKDNFIILSSESGVVDIPASEIVEKSVLGPGNMILVDTAEGKIIRNEEVKAYYANKHPYQEWLSAGLKHVSALSESKKTPAVAPADLKTLWKLFGYTDEVIRTVLLPMAEAANEPTISMGFDAPLAVLSGQSQSLYNFFKQQFAQVTNPPIDAIREKIVIGTETYLGEDGNPAEISAQNVRKLKLESPVLSTSDFEKVLALKSPHYQTEVVSTLYDKNDILENALNKLFYKVEELINQGATIIVLSDRDFAENKVPMPILLALSGLYHYMLGRHNASKFAIIVDTAEACEVHHFAALVGYGASGIHPYGAYATLCDWGMGTPEHLENFRQAAEKGIVKVMSRMGISTIVGYKGAQLFEAIGLSKELVDKYFAGTSSRIGGLSLAQLENEYRARYEKAYGHRSSDLLETGGSFQYRADEGEHHIYDPMMIYEIQNAVRQNNYEKYKKYSQYLNEEAQKSPTSLRHLWEIKSDRKSISLSQVEPAQAIVKRFKIGAMSFGSLSKEAHECLAQAMNSIGAKSNSGEGGENLKRYGTIYNSKIKQVASGRFGVSAAYLMSAEEIQIKISQGAKPGEGGQLPGKKAFPWVAEVRNSTPGVSLISPPPHHDIYSIEDLSQLIFDLKQINPYAKINVKLVSSTGVGTIATGCVKAGADKVVISGYDGGTGASPRNSTRDAGLPWEMGLVEAHQTLTMNNLRDRMTLETDGKVVTGRDIAVAAMLGAEEYSFGSLALVAIGCIMTRNCHLNTCPVGIATQNPKLRANFMGKPEHIVRLMFFMAEELRELLAELGFRTIDELVGHAELLQSKDDLPDKMRGLDFSRMLGQSLPIAPKHSDPFANPHQWQELDHFTAATLDAGVKATVHDTIKNTNRTATARMAGWLAERYGNFGLKDGSVNYEYTGVAGQSFGSYATAGMEVTLIGEANDYIGKSLSGGRLIVKPPVDAAYDVENTSIVGNVSLFGAIAGEAYFRGRAGERCGVRNSGAQFVVEGVGDHGCEYMTGGVAVILGKTGRNFAAGMSGGVAYVYDRTNDFSANVNHEMVDLYHLNETEDDEILEVLLKNHLTYTNSEKARFILENWTTERAKFVKVYPREYHHIKTVEAELAKTGLSGDALTLTTFEKVTEVM